MAINEILGAICVALALLFFLSGSIGLLRFPDIYCRLHSLTKADNVGLLLVILGLILSSDNWRSMARLLLIWLLVLVASSMSCHLVARCARQKGIAPGRNNP